MDCAHGKKKKRNRTRSVNTAKEAFYRSQYMAVLIYYWNPIRECKNTGRDQWVWWCKPTGPWCSETSVYNETGVQWWMKMFSSGGNCKYSQIYTILKCLHISNSQLCEITEGYMGHKVDETRNRSSGYFIERCSLTKSGKGKDGGGRERKKRMQQMF